MKRILVTAVLCILALALFSCNKEQPKESDGAVVNNIFSQEIEEVEDLAPQIKKEERLARMHISAPLDAEEGKCGDDVIWYIDGDWLFVEGKGAMWDYSLTAEAPWASRGSEIRRITVGDGVSVIGSFAFANLKELQKVNIAGDVVFIGSNAFCNSSLIEVDIPRNADLYEIERYAFSGCSRLETIGLPEKLKYIGSNAFENCTALYDVVFKDELLSIEDYAFMGCSSLKYAVLTKNLESVGTWAFAKCTDLRELYVADQLKRIPAGLCFGCESLEKVNFSGTSEEWNSIDFGADNEAILSCNIIFTK